jgi:DNA-binding MarR family transcriptional regulator
VRKEALVAASAMDEALLGAARAVMRISLHAADQVGGVSVVQLRALTILLEAGETNLASLAEGMGVTVSTTSRLVDRLVAAGLVERRTAEHTRREIAVRLTELGRQTVDRYDGHRLTELRRCIDALSETDRIGVLTCLRALAGGAAQPLVAMATRPATPTM